MAQGPNNNDPFFGATAQFMQAGQNMAQQFMDYIGKAGGAEAVPQAPADPQALTALQKQFMDQQMSLWQSMLSKQHGKEQSFKVAPEPGDRRFSAPEWRESPVYDYIHQAYLLNTQFLKGMVDDPATKSEGQSAEEELAEAIRRLAESKTASADVK